MNVYMSVWNTPAAKANHTHKVSEDRHEFMHFVKLFSKRQVSSVVSLVEKSKFRSLCEPLHPGFTRNSIRIVQVSWREERRRVVAYGIGVTTDIEWLQYNLINVRDQCLPWAGFKEFLHSKNQNKFVILKI